MASEELDISNQPEPDRYDALLCYPSPSLVEQVPKPLPCKAELNLSGRAQNAVSGLGDIDGIELAIAEFAKTGNREARGPRKRRVTKVARDLSSIIQDDPH